MGYGTNALVDLSPRRFAGGCKLYYLIRGMRLQLGQVVYGPINLHIPLFLILLPLPFPGVIMLRLFAPAAFYPLIHFSSLHSATVDRIH